MSLARRLFSLAGGLALGAFGAFAAPALCAQPKAAARPRVGVLAPGPAPARPGEPEYGFDRFRQGLSELGLVDGRNVELLFRYDHYDAARMAAQAAELVALKVDVLVAGTTGSTIAAKQATATIPIVMAVSADPVADGLVASLAQPGGNVTGLSIMSPELTPKRLQLLAEMVPGVQRVALLLDGTFRRRPTEVLEYEQAAQRLGLKIVQVETGSTDDFPRAFDAARRVNAQAMVLMQSVLFATNWQRLAALALEHRLPAVAGSGDRQFARSGGLMNYGANIATSWHRAATYVQRILQGTRPAQLPIEQPTRFELAINRRTAATLGLQVPNHLLLLADEVIS